ncbi:MAG: hypothetical protein EOO56_18225 [Hymenobacter sp.]|nr:MAG: hypothetical protein EOO56_18225 [Hymenobacter sp.]
MQVVLATQAGQVASPLIPVPNPATGTVLVTLPVGTTQLRLLNMLGQAQWEALVPPSSVQYQVPLAGLAPGAYQMVALGPAGPVCTRLLVY